MNEKLIIYKALDTYCVTTETNYNSRIQNARAIQKLPSFNSPEEIISYYCKYFGSSPSDFIVIK